MGFTVLDEGGKIFLPPGLFEGFGRCRGVPEKVDAGAGNRSKDLDDPLLIRIGAGFGKRPGAKGRRDGMAGTKNQDSDNGKNDLPRTAVGFHRASRYSGFSMS